ncbi:hypothetical protein [Desulfosoma sp.]|uniref:Uncharacterized protein n=1 Tax=Desulfacinum infernum TaxID=35837 RepID=A0A832A2I4_9BACT
MRGFRLGDEGITVDVTMNAEEQKVKRTPGGVAALFDDTERKELFRKYLIFLGWLEVAIFVGCWLYQLGTDGYDRFGPVERHFPWKVYFLVAFLSPVAVTFLLGTIVVGFNRYFGGFGGVYPADDGEDGPSRMAPEDAKSYKMTAAVAWLQKLPYLGLLILLGAAVGVVYHLDVVLRVIGEIGEQTVRVALMAGGTLLAVTCFFALVFLLLNYKLRKRSMEYHYKSQVAERYGLVILEDNTVLNRDGKLLVRGKKWKDAVPLLDVTPENASPRSAQEALPHAPAPDCNT